jgi:hypothetical protein
MGNWVLWYNYIRLLTRWSYGKLDVKIQQLTVARKMILREIGGYSLVAYRIRGCSSEITRACLGFEVFTTVVMKGLDFRGIMPCCTLKADRSFGGTWRQRLQGRRISQARNQYEAHKNSWSLLWFIGDVGWLWTGEMVLYRRRRNRSNGYTVCTSVC